MRIYAIWNNKGGTGETSLTLPLDSVSHSRDHELACWV